MNNCLPEKHNDPNKLRNEMIKAHCEQQNCEGCPAQYMECAEAEAELEARMEEEAYNTMEDDF